MARFAAVAGLVFALMAWALPARAQGDLHGSGEGELSRDGALLAFYAQGTPRNAFVALDVASGKSFRFVLPAGHHEMRDLVWAQSSSTLLFVSRTGDGSPASTFSIPSGHGTHIWAIDFTKGDPKPAKVIAHGSGFRWPALSPDESKVAYFHPVPLPREEPPNSILWPQAFGVFETDIATGEVVRASKSQYGLPRRLYYHGKDAWLFSADHPQYVNVSGRSEFWSSVRPGSPPAMGTFDQLTEGIKSFRMERGETLPGYPEFRRPWPPMGMAPVRSALVGVTTDGRPVLYGAPGPENTPANQMRNSASYYVDGLTRIEMMDGYIAFGPDDAREIFFPPALPAGYDSNTGGAGMDGAMKRYFNISMKADLSKPDAGRSTSRLFLYEGQTLLIERDVSDIVAKAETVHIAE